MSLAQMFPAFYSEGTTMRMTTGCNLFRETRHPNNEEAPFSSGASSPQPNSRRVRSRSGISLLLGLLVLSSSRLLADPGDQNWDDRFAPTGLPGSVRALAVIGTNVYAGGDFGGAYDVRALGIAKWNGRSWSALATGLTNAPGGRFFVGAIAVSGTDVYVGGEFAMAGGVSV